MDANIKVIQKPVRGDKVFDEFMRARDVERLLRIAPFKDMDADAFPATNTLRQIIRADTRIRRYDENEIVVRQGDYGDSAFLVLAGSVVTVFDLDERLLGRKTVRAKSWWDALAQLWRNPALPEARDLNTYALKQDLAYAATAGAAGQRIFLPNMPVADAAGRGQILGAGELFGQDSTMDRAPRSATVVAAERTELLEIKWQALRDFMRHSKRFRQHTEDVYRERSLSAHVRNIPQLSGLNDSEIAEVCRYASFESYGDVNWATALRRDKSDAVGKAVDEIVVSEGDYADGLLLVRTGFLRLSRRKNQGQEILCYLKRGDIFGLEETLENLRASEPQGYRCTVSAVGYADILRIPAQTLNNCGLTAGASADRPGKRQLESNNHLKTPLPVADIAAETMEFFASNLFINGSKAMVINLDRCTECDDCVVACANAHGGNPRFIRHGPKVGKYMVANACMHCYDPVCMVGCPTGAIHRNVGGGEVVINDQACIGCATCANSCPYDNIRMTTIISSDAEPVLDEAHHPINKATKCDFCVEQKVAPACEYACPNNALKRLDLGNLATTGDWLSE